MMRRRRRRRRRRTTMRTRRRLTRLLLPHPKNVILPINRGPSRWIFNNCII
jgi:hypothetical protein